MKANMPIRWIAAAAGCLLATAAAADPPPASAPPYRPGVSLQPTSIYKPDGSLWDPSGSGAAAGKIVETSVSLSANTSTQLVPVNLFRTLVEIQCDGAAVVGISRTGATLTSATAAPLVIPAGSYQLYTMPIATLTAITAYTATAQTCRVTEYLR